MSILYDVYLRKFQAEINAELLIIYPYSCPIKIAEISEKIINDIKEMNIQDLRKIDS